MSNHPAVTPTFTKSDESWSVETLLVLYSLQIFNNSDNVFKNYDVTKVDIFRLSHQEVRISILTTLICICIECVINLCFFY